MTSFAIKSLNVFCIIGYLLFMGIAIDSTMVNALVFYVIEEDGEPTLVEGTAGTATLGGSGSLVALQFQSKPLSTARSASLRRAERSAKMKQMLQLPLPEQVAAGPTVPSEEKPPMLTVAADKVSAESIQMVKALPDPAASAVSLMSKEERSPASTAPSRTEAESPAPAAVAPSPEDATEASESRTADLETLTDDQQTSGSDRISILNVLKILDKKPWSYNPVLNRYVVKYDSDTTVVLTLRPALQRSLEASFKRFSAKIGAGIIQDPRTGAILAMVSYDNDRILQVTDKRYPKDNHALKANFPVASIFKIITAAAGFDTGKITAKSRFKAWKRYYMEVWQAFARSHNGVFGRIARKVGRSKVQAFANAFGFNKPFYFDLDVEKSVAKLPTDATRMGQAAAGLNKNFQVSPLHVASIVSTVLNNGRHMKPYLVDYVLQKNRVVFRRKPFPLAQPIKKTTARQLHRLMHTTTTKGTGRRGFNGYSATPNLASICGGKTGTLTGKSPRYLFTWFGGFTKAAGRELTIVTLIGQKKRSGTKAVTVAGRLAYQMALGSQKPATSRVAAKK